MHSRWKTQWGPSLGGTALRQLQRVDPGGDERPGCSAQAPFPFPHNLSFFHPSLVFPVEKVEGTLPSLPFQDPWVWAGTRGIIIGRGAGSGQNPFLRASSLCLRADEVGLIMTNLEKANQVRSPVLGAHFACGGGVRPGQEDRATLNLYFLDYMPCRVKLTF